MSPEVYTAEAVQQAIAQGAITEAYQADPQHVIQALGDFRKKLSFFRWLTRG